MNRTYWLLISVASLCSFEAISQQFSKAQILSDLEYLAQSLEDSHYNLYAYTPMEEFDLNYRQVKRSITQDSINLLEATSLFQKVISIANTGHAEIDLPIAAYREYAMNGGTLFPIEIAIEDEKAFIRKNFSFNTELQIGSEIIAIDNRKIQLILDEIYPQLSAETIYFKNAKLEFWTFPRLYWQVFGRKDSFMIRIKNKNEIKDVAVQAIDLIEGYEKKRTDILSSNKFLKFYKNAAFLKPGNFSGDESQFKKFIDSAFVEINKRSFDNLIIDLRNNAGGHDSFSDYLVSYFSDKPFKWHSKFTLKSSKILKEQTRLNNDTTDLYFKKILEHEDSEIYEYRFDNYPPQQVSKRFSGKVYVLTNRHTYSMAAVIAAMMQDLEIATIVGEETGDFPTLYASQIQYPLPTTGIIVKVPKGYIVRVNGDENKRGVIPDILFKDHLIDENDEILNGLLKIIAN